MHENDIASPLREAERHIAIAFGRLGKLGLGGLRAWVGAWQEYQLIGKLLTKTIALREQVEQRQRQGRFPTKAGIKR